MRNKIYFSINLGRLIWFLLCHYLFFSSRVRCKGSCFFHDDFHCFEVVFFDLLIGKPAVSLSGSDPAVTQQILHCLQLCIGIEHLIGPGVAQTVTRHLKLHRSRAVVVTVEEKVLHDGISCESWTHKIHDPADQVNQHQQATFQAREFPTSASHKKH